MRLLVAERWDEFARVVLPKGVSLVQKQEMRRAFYAGAQELLYGITGALTADHGEQPTAEDLEVMNNLQRELSDFAELVKAGRA